MTAAGRPPGWWRCRALGPDGAPRWLATVWSTARVDGDQVDLPEPGATTAVGDDAVAVARFGPDGAVTRLEVTTLTAPKAPPLWFLELREPAAAPPAVHLLAFTGHGVAPGFLLDDAAVRGTVVTIADQLGAVRWYPATGEVDQIYVDPAWRRRSIGTALVAAGTTLSVARGGGRFWGDGQRTELGERWRNAGTWGHRTAPLSHLAPPMTPGSAAEPS